MTQDTQIVTAEYREIQLGALSAASPRAVVERAVEVATELAKIVREKKLSRAISGREYVYVEGWTTLGAMLGVVPREVSTAEQENGDYCAVVELVRVSDGAVIGRGSAILGTDETTWANRPRYARRSMCVTRATGKAFRLTFSWVMKLAGYEPTPAEEMEPEAERPARPAAQPGNGQHSETPEEREARMKVTRAVFGDPGAPDLKAQPAEGEKFSPAVNRLHDEAANWRKAVTKFVELHPEYQTQIKGKPSGQPDNFHLMGAARKCGFAEVTDDNWATVLESMQRRAQKKAEVA